MVLVGNMHDIGLQNDAYHDAKAWVLQCKMHGLHRKSLVFTLRKATFGTKKAQFGDAKFLERDFKWELTKSQNVSKCNVYAPLRYFRTM